MRKITIFAVIAIFAIIAALYACQKEEAIKKTDVNNSSEKLIDTTGVIDKKTQSFVELKQSLKVKFGIDLIIVDTNLYKFIYHDGKELFLQNVSEINTITIYGNKINGEVLNFSFNPDENNFGKNIEIYKSCNKMSTQFFLNIVNPDANSPIQKLKAAETFSQCFKREWNDFCDDAVSCIAQATNPVIVGVAIAIHCAALAN